MEDGTKVRIARGQEASGAIIPRPEILKMRKKPRPTEGTLKFQQFNLITTCEKTSIVSFFLFIPTTCILLRRNMLQVVSKYTTFVYVKIRVIKLGLSNVKPCLLFLLLTSWT